ncbi:MAG: DinB family protein [Bacillota bacterium]
MRFEVYLDTSRKSGRVMAHVLEPPGLGIRFESRASFEREMGGAISEHLRWLASHGLWESPPPQNGSVEWAIAEEQPIEGDFESGDDVGFYGPDLAPLSRDEVERYLQIARCAREGLVALVRRLPPEAFDWRYNEKARPIRQILRHVANAELWYITRVIDDPSKHGMPPELDALDRRMDASSDPVERLLMVREGFERFFRMAPDEVLNQVTTPSWFCEILTERWTARKALRRAIEHEREHTRSILWTLASHGFDLSAFGG